MRKMMLMLLLVCAMASFAIYTVGATAADTDNIDWTVEGPSWHPDFGTSDKLFDMIRKGKPVMIFFGGRT